METEWVRGRGTWDERPNGGLVASILHLSVKSGGESPSAVRRSGRGAHRYGGQHATGAIRRARDRTRSGIMPTCVHPASRDQALAAIREFHAEHGRLPRWREWERAAASRPCAKTIERRWGWRQLSAEAVGVRSAEIEVSWVPVLDDRAEAMLVALRA